MALIVQKYGGTSVGDQERIRSVARRIRDCRDRGDRIVAVVSAMKGVTNQLLGLAQGASGPEMHPKRELDMLLATGEQTTGALLAMTLHDLNVPAISLTGGQAGIKTDSVHSKARIKYIDPERIIRPLEVGMVVIVAGFQGQDDNGNVTTLGRGGSDLSAIAIAAATNADLCQIYTDVDGVFTADPRLVPQARKIDEITYEEMLELASAGAKVMQPRSVEYAEKLKVRFEVRSSLNQTEGTIVKEETQTMEQVVVRGVSLDENQAKLTLIDVPDRPGVAAKIFQALDRAAVNVDMIVQNTRHGSAPSTDMSFTVDRHDLATSRRVIETLKPEFGIEKVQVQEKMGKLSVVGVGMKSHSGIAAKIFDILARENVNIDMISTSEIKLSVVISSDRSQQALRAVHTAFLE